MRKTLDFLYLASGYLAAIFLAGIAVVTGWQVVSRYFGKSIETTELAGFFLAASTFLALAHTYRNGVHVRVGLVIERLSKRHRRIIELWCCVMGALVLGYITYHFALFTQQSYDFKDVSPGLMAIPFWIPQIGILLGLAILTIAFVDEAYVVFTGGKALYEEVGETAFE